MASNSNPSPSPRRSSEISNPMRKSFIGNPFSKPSLVANPTSARSVFPNTPANSPSDFQRRNSVAGRESGGSLRYVDDKENGKDQTLKAGKVRSPAACSKGSKNFMSPTISASCKIIESPRKKVLTERNEPVPDSVPSAEAKSNVRKVTFAEPLECGGLQSDHLDLVEERKLDSIFDGVPNFEESHNSRSSLTSEEDLSDESETVHDISVPLVPNNDTDVSFEAEHDLNVPLVLEDDKIETEPSFETVSLDHDCVNLGPTFKLSPTPPPASSTATILAPLDADPLMPPYDPKTNYLSPRPRFLHYKPRPRMELCSESIISGSFSDTEVTEDSQSEASQKEAEEVSSDEAVMEEESQSSDEPSPAEGTIEAKEAPKRRFSMRSKAFGLIFLLSFAVLSISVINSPVVHHTVFEDMYEAYEASQLSEFARANFDQFTQFAKAKFDCLAQNLHIRFIKSLTSISELISNVKGLQIHSLAQLQCYNLTVVPDHVVVNQYHVFRKGKNEVVDAEIQSTVLHIQESEVISDIDTDDEDDSEDISEEHYEIYEEQVQQELGIITEAESALDAPQPEQVLKLAEAGISYEIHAQEEDAHFFNVEDSDIHIDVKQTLGDGAMFNIEKPSNEGLEHLPSLGSEIEEIHAEVYDEEAEGNYATVDAAITRNEKRSETTDITPRMMLYLLLCGGALIIAGVSFNFSRKGKIGSKRVTSSVEQPLIGKEFYANNSLQTLNKKQISPEKTSLRNGPIEMDVLELEEPCPSEMSSFQQGSSQGDKAMNQSDEDHSVEKKRKKHYRRESWASSDYSMGSASSYGSLTVYEKIPSKQGDGDVGIVTPVRRSSRIRNLATSPS